MHVVLPLAALLLLSAGDGHLAPFPEVDFAKAKPAVVLATLAEGPSYADFEECGRKSPEGEMVTICLESAGFQVQGRLVRTLYGVGPSGRFSAGTTSHSEPPYADDPGPYVLLLATDGEAAVMPRYAFSPAFRTVTGDWMLPLGGPHELDWLPCGAAELREPLAESHFPAGTWTKLAIHEDGPGWYSVGQLPDWFTRSRRVAHPRFGVSVARLEAFLASTAPDMAAMGCRPETAAGDGESDSDE